MLKSVFPLFRKLFLVVFILGSLGSFVSSAQAGIPNPPWSSAQGPDGLRALMADESGILLELRTSGMLIKDEVHGGKKCQVVQVEGYGQSANPGWPQLPISGTMLGIPTAAQLEMTILEALPAQLEGGYDICPAAQPVAEINWNAPPRYIGEQVQRDQKAYSQRGFAPGALAEIVSTGFIRSQRVAQIRFQPFQYDPTTSKLRYYPRILVRVDFRLPSGTEQESQQEPLIDEGSFEAILHNLLANYEQARQWRTSQMSEKPVSSALEPAVAGPTYKLLVKQDGIYQVTQEELTAAGANFTGVNPQTIQLFNAGMETAIYVTGAFDGKFDPGDKIIFYGQGLNTKYTDTNVYYLTWGVVNGKRMSGIGTTIRPVPVPTYFMNTSHFETNFGRVSSVPSGADEDVWYWTSAIATSAPASATVSGVISNLAVTAPVSATVRGLLKGYDANTLHHTRIYINNHLVEDATWPKGADHPFEIDIPVSYLQEGSNELKVSLPWDLPDKTRDIVFINWFELEYPDTYVAETNRLVFNGGVNGSLNTLEFRVSGFTASDLEAYDITDPYAVARMILTSVIEEVPGTSYRLQFKSTFQDVHKFMALSAATRMSVVGIVLDSSSNLHTAQQADYIVITHPAFASALDPLVQLRQGQGFTTKVVLVDDVYDEFNHGVMHPAAIRDFLAYAYQFWLPPKPQYVLLVGDGHYDPRNYMGYGEPIYIPPFLAQVDPGLGETATDNAFVTLSAEEDLLPDMHIGRFPVQTVTQTTAIVNKITSYEQNEPTGAWRSRLLFVADNPDSDGNFNLLSDTIANNYLPPYYQRVKSYYLINDNTPAATIINTINQGALLVNYIGHASQFLWGHSFLTKTTLGSLTNADSLPFFVPMTCLEGYFIEPSPPGLNYASLAEAFLIAAGKGSLASFSPTGLGVATGHDLLNKGLYEALFQDRITRLGPATTQAKFYLYDYSGGSNLDLLDTYLLLGDPASNLWALYLDYQAYIPLVLQPLLDP